MRPEFIDKNYGFPGLSDVTLSRIRRLDDSPSIHAGCEVTRLELLEREKQITSLLSYVKVLERALDMATANDTTWSSGDYIGAAEAELKEKL